MIRFVLAVLLCCVPSFASAQFVSSSYFSAFSASCPCGANCQCAAGCACGGAAATVAVPQTTVEWEEVVVPRYVTTYEEIEVPASTSYFSYQASSYSSSGRRFGLLRGRLFSRARAFGGFLNRFRLFSGMRAASRKARLCARLGCS